MGYSWVYLLWCTLPGFYGRFRFLGFASCFLGFNLPFFPSVIFGSSGRSESNVLLSGLSSVSLSEAGCRLGVKLLSDVLDFPLVPEVVRFSLFFPLVYLWNLGSGFPGCLLYPGFTVVFQFYNARAGFMLNGFLFVSIFRVVPGSWAPALFNFPGPRACFTLLCCLVHLGWL